MNDKLDKETWLAWQDHPATKALHLYLHKQVERLQREWVEGRFTDQSQFATAIENAKAIGVCQASLDIAGLEYDEIIGELDDE